MVAYSPGKSGNCFSFSFLLPCLPNKPATKLFLRLATLNFSGLGFSGVVSSTLVGGVSSPAKGDALMLERDYDQVSIVEALDAPQCEFLPTLTLNLFSLAKLAGWSSSITPMEPLPFASSSRDCASVFPLSATFSSSMVTKRIRPRGGGTPSASSRCSDSKKALRWFVLGCTYGPRAESVRIYAGSNVPAKKMQAECWT